MSGFDDTIKGIGIYVVVLFGFWLFLGVFLGAFLSDSLPSDAIVQSCFDSLVSDSNRDSAVYIAAIFERCEEMNTVNRFERGLKFSALIIISVFVGIFVWSFAKAFSTFSFYGAAKHEKKSIVKEYKKNTSPLEKKDKTLSLLENARGIRDRGQIKKREIYPLFHRLAESILQNPSENKIYVEETIALIEWVVEQIPSLYRGKAEVVGAEKASILSRDIKKLNELVLRSQIGAKD